MSSLTFKTDPPATELPRDANGYLFDPHIREILARTGRRVDPGTEALAAVRMLGKRMHALMERWADQHGLSEGRFQILVRLHHTPSGRMTMGDLAETLDVSPRTVTGLVDNLERDGLVKRVDDPGDRRTVHAELTDQGRERVKALWRGAAAELVQLRHLCLRLMQAMGVAEGGHRAAR